MTFRDEDQTILMETSPGASMRFEPGMHALDGTGRKVMWLRADGLWWWDARKDEDPRHQWRDTHLDCDRCEMSVYDMSVLGKHAVLCDGERRNAAWRWVP